MKYWHRVLSIGSFLAACAGSLGAEQQKTPKEECEALMTALLPVAQQMLSKHREFYPYGGTMSPDGGIAHTAGYTGTERPPSQAVVELLEKAFQHGAKRGAYKATALVLDVRTTPPGKTAKQDAVQVRLDHASGYSVIVLFPYAFAANGEVEFAEPFGVRGEGKIFGAAR